MASGGAASPRLIALEIYWNPPLSEFHPLSADHFVAVTGMWFMTDTAGAAFAIDDNMDVVQVSGTVAEVGVNCGISETKEVFLMAIQAKSVNPVLVGGVDVGGITAPEHPEVI